MVKITSEAAPDDHVSRSKPSPADSPAGPPLRLWPPVLIVAALWIFMGVLNSALDLVISTNFMLKAAGSVVAALAFLIWWLASRRITWSDKLLPLVVAAAGAVACVMVSLQTLGALGAVFVGVPLVLSVWTVWLLVSRRLSGRTRRIGLVVAILLVWAGVSLVRVDGVDGRMMPSTHWRWTPTAEELYLAERARAGEADVLAAPIAAGAEPLALAVGDWPGFRGPDCLGEQNHAAIVTNWNDAPPKLLWKRHIGPAWSSIVVIGGRLFTQEQRGEDEATVCLDCATGIELWAHVDRARFWDGQAGAGPRATPTFHDGRLYTFGATAILNCLDAAGGKLLWTRDVLKETGAPWPMWGFSSSPLVVDDVVIVFAGGPDDRGLVAYRTLSGDPAWNAAAGPISYSSAQQVTLAGQCQVLLLSDTGVVAVDPSSGKRLWQYDVNGHGVWRVVQPRPFDNSQVLVGSEDMGLTLLDVRHDGIVWTAAPRWVTKEMRPAFNDYVVVDEVAYGFDKGLFCATDLATSKRLWKKGRYGFGQVLLLTPQNLLIVLTERGEAVLLAANREKLEELGRFQAVSGKTWNHPVVVRNRLYVRNDTEMAAYELTPAEGS
ncbi:MAG: PQQ-binding-like beta-propeller repeat protein [Pirellulales bacterium]